MRLGMFFVVVATGFIGRNVALETAISDQPNLPEVMVDPTVESVVKNTNNYLRGLKVYENEERVVTDRWKLLLKKLRVVAKFQQRVIAARKAKQLLERLEKAKTKKLRLIAADESLDEVAKAKQLMAAGASHDQLKEKQVSVETMFKALGLDDDLAMNGVKMTDEGFMNLDTEGLRRVNQLYIGNNDIRMKVAQWNEYRWKVNNIPVVD
ncbi:RxLR effector protein [Phytophthora megakarya]|uniref:RxLR effector protein n=1 Tax=Phytophthora megakarya TaxID=4795 RepID=A0A225WJH3_9STRA|nr:RxLR effector protein [Phytophthora megakarya]